jgi:hypothetical protein
MWDLKRELIPPWRGGVALGWTLWHDRPLELENMRRAIGPYMG